MRLAYHDGCNTEGSLGELFHRLETMGIALRWQDGRLHCLAPKGAMGPDLIGEIKARREEIAEWMRSGAFPFEGADNAIPRVPRSARIPLSLSQRRVWLLHHLHAGRASYNETGVFDVSGPLVVSALEQSLAQIARRHEILRTTFPQHEGIPFQRIASPELGPRIHVVDVRSLPAHDQDRVEDEAISLAQTRGFDIARDDLLVSTLLLRGDDRCTLVISLHHLVWDGWSKMIFAREMDALYRSYALGEPAHLPELPVQYADFACWQHRFLEKPDFDSHLQYWREHLQGAPPELDLPFDFPRPGAATGEGATYSVTIPHETADRLFDLSRRNGATPFMALLTVVHVLLGKYAQQSDLCVGVPISLRSRAELEGLIGFFLNTLVLRADISGNPTFLEMLGRTRSACIAGYDHADVPFEVLVERLQPSRSAEHQPLFQVLFAYHDHPQLGFSSHGVTMRERILDTHSAKFDLSILPRPTDEGLRISLEYSTEMFQEATIRGMADGFCRLIDQVLASPQSHLSALRVESGADAATVGAWGRGPSPQEAWQCVHLPFERWAGTTTDAVALVCDGNHITYGEANRRANQLAHRLREAGVAGESAVGVCMHRSADAILSILAVVKAGAGYVPLDPAYPNSRLLDMIAYSRARVLLVDEATARRVSGFGGTVVVVTPDWRFVAAYPTEDLPCIINAANVLSVLFTSGSTGNPKGVCMPHSVVHNMIQWYAATRRRRTRTLQFASISFDVSMMEIFGAWFGNGTLVIPDEYLRFSAEGMLAFVAEQQVESAVFPVVFLQELAGAANVNGQVPRTLREVSSTGDRLLVTDAIRKMVRAIPGVAFHNYYGPTEIQVITDIALGEDMLERDPAPPVGYPVTGIHVCLLDPYLEPVPMGCKGEVWATNAACPRGYLYHPALTADRFRPSPYGGPGDRMYRLGDIGRWRSGGQLELLGRADQMVKIRGFRVDTEEIRSVLLSCPDVADAVMAAKTDDHGVSSLVAYVVPVASSGQLDTATLIAHLRTLVPYYMVPTTVITLDRLPVTPNGKVDRRALPSVNMGQPLKRRPHIPPLTPTEVQVAAIWSRVLGVEGISADEDFFDLGGHSLLAARIVHGVREDLGVDLSIADLFEAPILSALSQRIDAKGSVSWPPIERLPAREYYDISHAQRRLLSIDQCDRGSLAYVSPVTFMITGALDRVALERSLLFLSERHEILRTSFPFFQGDYRQRISSPRCFAMTFVDLRRHTSPEDALDDLIRAERTTPFSLDVAPLWRTTLVQMDDARWALLVTMQHLLFDGWSGYVFYSELCHVYTAYTTNQPVEIAPVAVQYKDYAAWHNCLVETGALDADREYFLGKFSAPPQTLDLPLDKARPAEFSFRGDIIHATILPSASLEALALWSRECDANTFHCCVAASVLLLWLYTGQQDVTIGTVSAGQVLRSLSQTMGFFTNTLALRIFVDGAAEMASFMQTVKRTCVDALTHQNYPFDRLVGSIGVPWNRARSPLFDVMVIYQDFRGTTTEISIPHGIQVEALPQKLVRSLYDLKMEFTPTDGGLLLNFEYSTDLFEEATAVSMVDDLKSVLDCMISGGARTVDEVRSGLGGGGEPSPADGPIAIQW